ncbi:MAG: DMT family transporter [Parachlamydiales bacterium]
MPYFLFALWSCCFPLGKIALFSSTPLFFTASRMLFASFLILGYLFIKKRADLKFTIKQGFAILLLAMLSMYFPNALEYYGLQHLSAAKTCFIYSLTPFFAAFFSYLHFNEKMNPKKWLGMIIGFIGVMPIFFIQTGSENITTSFLKISYPELAVIGATIFSVYGWVLLRILVKDNSLSPLTANSYGMLIGGILALIHSYFFDAWNPIPVTSGSGANFLQGLVIITLISNVICYNLYGFLLKKYTATFMSFVGLLSPIFASLSEWLFLKTPPSPIILVSTFVIIFGLWIIYKEELKQGYIVKTKKTSQEQV